MSVKSSLVYLVFCYGTITKRKLTVGKVGYNISESVKGQLVLNIIEGERSYTYGEIISCVRLLIKLVKQHRSPSGIGYLHWIKTFYEGNMPKTESEIREYIQKYES